ncbi:MAG: RNA methyltransferase [Crocinitomicaceae bacterium]
MACDEYLQERIEIIVNAKKVQFEAKKMMDRLCYMIDVKMCFGIIKNDFMARAGEKTYEQLVELDGSLPMDFTKRPMKDKFTLPQKELITILTIK